MRALHIIQRYYPYVGGSERYFQEISERLADEGHRVTVLTTDAWDIEHFWSRGKKRIDCPVERHRGVDIRRFPVRQLPGTPWFYPVMRRLMAEISNGPPNTEPILGWLARLTPWVPALERHLARLGGGYDVVHATNIPFDSLIGAAERYARQHHLPLLVTPFTHLGEDGQRQVRKYYSMRHQIGMMRRSRSVIVQTERERRFLEECGVPTATLERVGVGVDPAELAGGDGDRFRRRHQIAGPIVFSLGTTAFDKGTQHLVQAIDELGRRGVEATLVLAGPTMEHFVRFLERQPPATRHRCRLLGFVSAEEKRDLLAAGDVFAMPSRTDSFGIVYLEAWLYEKPVVGARAGGVPEVIREGEDGYLVRFGDVSDLAGRIAALLADPARAREFGRRGRERVLRQFTWDQVYARMREIYRHAVDPRAA